MTVKINLLGHLLAAALLFMPAAVYSAPLATENYVKAVSNTLNAAKLDRSFFAPKFTGGVDYNAGDIVEIDGKYYMFVSHWGAAWTNSSPVAEGVVRGLPDFPSLAAEMLDQKFLPIGATGTNTSSYKAIETGRNGNKTGYFTFWPDGVQLDDTAGGRLQLLGRTISHWQTGVFTNTASGAFFAYDGADTWRLHNVPPYEVDEWGDIVSNLYYEAVVTRTADGHILSLVPAGLIDCMETSLSRWDLPELGGFDLVDAGLVSVDLSRILQTSSIVDMSNDKFTEEYRWNPTSPYYIYRYLADNYLTALMIGKTYLSQTSAASNYLSKVSAETTYLSKTQAEADYLSKREAETLYTTPNTVDAKIRDATVFLHDADDTSRLYYDGSMRRRTQPTNFVANIHGDYTNETSGAFFVYTGNDTWTLTNNTVYSSLYPNGVTVMRTNVVENIYDWAGNLIALETNSYIRSTGEWGSVPRLIDYRETIAGGSSEWSLRDIGTFTALQAPADGGWELSDTLVKKSEIDSLVASSISNNFSAMFTPVIAPIVTNVVEDVLAPRTLEFHYNSADGVAITNGLVAPMFATSKLTFVNDFPELNIFRGDSAVLYSEGRRRNYSLLVEKIPDGLECFTITYYELATNHTIYAQPKLYTSKTAVDESGERLTHAWDLTTNDIPCVITVREPDDHTLIVRRDRLNQDEVYLKLENGEAIMYIDGEEN